MTGSGLSHAWIGGGLALAGVLATALVHSSALLGAAWIVVRRGRPEPRVEELI